MGCVVYMQLLSHQKSVCAHMTASCCSAGLLAQLHALERQLLARCINAVEDPAYNKETIPMSALPLVGQVSRHVLLEHVNKFAKDQCHCGVRSLDRTLVIDQQPRG